MRIQLNFNHIFKSMRIVLSLLLFLFSRADGYSQLQFAEVKPTRAFAKIQFDSMSYHFGKMIQGQIIDREIWFTNTGNAELKIELITACECTTLDWSRLPIPAGSRSKIKLSYNSKDKDGPQIVDIEVIANTEPASTYTKFYLEVNQ